MCFRLRAEALQVYVIGDGAEALGLKRRAFVDRTSANEAWERHVSPVRSLRKAEKHSRRVCFCVYVSASESIFSVLTCCVFSPRGSAL